MQSPHKHFAVKAIPKQSEQETFTSDDIRVSYGLTGKQDYLALLLDDSQASGQNHFEQRGQIGTSVFKF